MTNRGPARKTVSAGIFLVCLAFIGGLGYSGSILNTTRGGAGLLTWHPIRSVTYVVNPTGVPGFTTLNQTASINEVIRDAFQTWEETPDAYISLFYTGTSPLTQQAFDGTNLVSFQESSTSFPPGVVAVAAQIYALTPGLVRVGSSTFSVVPGQLLDVDILFNTSAYQFSLTGEGETIPIGPTAKHEVGHFLGLGHSGILSSIMNPYAESGSLALQGTLRTDDMITMASHYPANSFAVSRGTISGLISASDGSRVLAAHVIAVSNPGGVPVASVLSNANGAYSISGLPPGSYNVMVEPLDGPIEVYDFDDLYISANTNFGTTFFGGVTNPVALSVTAGQTSTADIVVPSAANPALNLLRIETIDQPGDARTIYLQRGKAYEITATTENLTVNPSLSFTGAGITARAIAGGIAPGELTRVTISSSAPLGPSNVLLRDNASLSALPGGIVVTDNPEVRLPPILSSLSPSGGNAEGPGFALTVRGSRFAADAVVRWNGADRPTTFVTANEVTASISASDIGTTGTAQITVSNPEGGISNSLGFAIDVPGNPVPSISTLSRHSATAGEAGFTLNVNGSNFLAGSVVQWNGAERVTTVASSSSLTASIPASDIATVGTAQVTVFNPPPGGGASNPLAFTISGPTITPGGTVNGASFAGGTPVTPGSIVSLFGTALASGSGGANGLPLPYELAGTRVRLNGIDAPLFFVSPAQINFQVPWELLGEAEVSVAVTSNGGASQTQTLSLASLNPGIFTVDSEGRGAVLISDTGELAAPEGSIPGRASRPVNREEFIAIYCTGIGAVSPPPVSGAAAPADPPSTTTEIPTVTIGGVPTTVSFSGLGPGFVGLYQVNVQVPAESPTGDAVELVLSINGVTANTVTIAVQ